MKEIVTDFKLGYDGVLIRPKFSTVPSRSEDFVDTSTRIGDITLKLPIISSNMDTITGVKMARKMAELGGLGLVHRYMSVEKQLAIVNSWPHDGSPLGLSLGTLKNDKERIDATLALFKDSFPGVKPKDVILCVDIAHGDSQHMIDTIKYIRDQGWIHSLMAGATCTYEGTKRLLDAGADIVRVGVGPGSACTTRIKTGCGYPQLSAVLECAEAGPIIADGGIRSPGDAAKAMAAGADAIMIGGMLSGTDCVPGWDIAMQSYFANIPNASLTDVKRHPEDMPSIKYRGMASAEARAAFGAAPVNAEGISCTVKARPEGSTDNVVIGIGEGIRSAMSYTNSTTLDEFYHNSVFIRVSPEVIQENSPHILSKADASPTWRL